MNLSLHAALESYPGNTTSLHEGLPTRDCVITSVCNECEINATVLYHCAIVCLKPVWRMLHVQRWVGRVLVKHSTHTLYVWL